MKSLEKSEIHLWTKHPLTKKEEWEAVDFYSHLLWIKSALGILSFSFTPKEKENTLTPGKNLQLTHYRVGQSCTNVQFAPRLPDRSIVVSHPDIVIVQPGEELLLFCALPLSVGVYEIPGDNPVAVFPFYNLSKTLFGETDSGEILYSCPKSLKLSPDEILNDHTHAVCPLKVRNYSRKQMFVKRLCVLVEHLSIYEYKNNLWTDSVCFTAKESNQNTQISVESLNAEQKKTYRKIHKAVTPFSKSLINKGFDFFKSIGLY